MGERKVLNKYYPPDFDPELLPRNRRPRGQQVTVRFMLPCSVQCNNCGEYIYRGKKFNAKKEEVIGGDYLGIRVWRFYFKCTNCVNEITILTDPKNADYICEHGASRNFEPWRQANEVNESLRKEKEEEEKLDAMRALENRTTSNKREMEELDKLEEIQELNALRKDVDIAAVIEARRAKEEEQQQAKLSDDEFDTPPEQFVRRVTEPVGSLEDDDAKRRVFFGQTALAQGNALSLSNSAAKPTANGSASSVSPFVSVNPPTPSRFGDETSGSLSGGLFAGAARAPIVAKRKRNVDAKQKEKNHKSQKVAQPADASKSSDASSSSSSSASSSASATAASSKPSGLALLSAYGDDDE